MTAAESTPAAPHTEALPVFETRTDAPGWEHGLITGSGRVGAVVFGPADRQTLCFSHERFFLPANPRPAAPDLADALPEIRRALDHGDGARASALMAASARRSGYGDGLVWTDPLGICASLTIAAPGGASDIVRSIDPEHGEVVVSWSSAPSGRHTLRAMAPRGSETVWVELSSDAGLTADLAFGLDADAGHLLETGAPDYSGVVHPAVSVAEGATVEARTGEHATSATTTVHGPLLSWTVADGENVARAAIVVPPGGRERFRVDLSVGGAGDHSPGLGVDWDALRRDQGSDHGSLVRASVLDLDSGTPNALTEEIWAAARTGDPDARRRVVEIAYLSGRSHIISSTGELPPTLQGVWQGTWKPAWSADYTMNGNVQNGAIAGLIPTGTPELAASLLNLVLPFLDDYRENARRIFGAEGMLLPSRMSTHGRADHFSEQFPHLFWVGCGGWVLRFAADLVSTTGDRSLVDDRLWELVEGVLRFGETATAERDGTVHFVPSYSPENAPAGGSPLVIDATMDVAIYRDAARAARILARARGDHSLDARWERLVSRLPAYRRSEDGTLAEWISPLWPENIAHRHASQLYPLWYETDPAFKGESAEAANLRAAAAATIAGKIAWRAELPTAPPGRMEMAFGLVQLGLAAAALGDARSALTCVEWLAIDHWRPSLTTTHDAGSIFNLDASGGLPGLVAAMLLGSDEASLTVLPALPPEWQRGAVTGLRARGGIVIDRLEWDARGCSVTLRRLAEASWIRPDGRVQLDAGFEFVLGASAPDGSIEVGERPTTIRLERTSPLSAG